MPKLNEVNITKAIISAYYDQLLDCCELDVAICGGGPSAMVAAKDLAKAGLKVAIFEKRVAPGGGMWGGGMLFNHIVLQEAAVPILEENGIRVKKYDDMQYTADAVETTAGLIYNAVNSGAKLFNGIYAEDVMVHDGRVDGIVINWTSVEQMGLIVDPLTINAKFVVDGTGHPTEIVKLVQDKNGIKLKTKTGRVMGEGSLDAERAEGLVEKNTIEIAPGLYVMGMAANAVQGDARMGPIFGGMLLSGKKVAAEIIAKLK